MMMRDLSIVFVRVAIVWLLPVGVRENAPIFYDFVLSGHIFLIEPVPAMEITEDLDMLV